MLFISKSLVDMADDHELAFVLGHEMAHAVCCHYAEELSLVHYASCVMGHAAQALAKLVVFPFSSDPQAEQEQQLEEYFYHYVRKQLPAAQTHEFEADTIGQRFAVTACFDRFAYRRWITKMESPEKKPSGRFEVREMSDELKAYAETMDDKGEFKALPEWMQLYLQRKQYWVSRHPSWADRRVKLESNLFEMFALHRSNNCHTNPYVPPTV